ncbi:purine-nucleoside phosphorylase [Thermotomaculum hydrothermale]|uniref:Purine nucleoside phosphorylase n=1 Tax=Thermotomaculum hydrothermale TaxID=981385 RepID=A0A7R6SYN1_9BACT|nr:purine-nucleoside phosphorylase [Thermotomaculum hydrothermale]BBB32954.1 purine-nucleoside phosphorylase [Thermotomaculum hydrothermale]
MDYINLSTQIKEKGIDNIDIAVVLGSGLGFLADEVKGKTIEYGEIKGFPKPTVEGHSGKMVLAQIGNKNVLFFQGRFHFYEGYSMKEVVIFPRIAKLLGAKLYLVTNAAGGINSEFKPGDLMVIKDHLNLMGTNPLIGKNHSEFGPRFPDMTDAYSPNLRKLLFEIGDQLGIELQSGVYAALTGPSYETPAEIKMLQALGADAVGMSTVPEVIAARHANLKVLGVSCITNLAAGVSENPLSHEEVLETTEKVKYHFGKLIMKFLETVEL